MPTLVPVADTDSRPNLSRSWNAQRILSPVASGLQPTMRVALECQMEVTPGHKMAVVDMEVPSTKERLSLAQRTPLSLHLQEVGPTTRHPHTQENQVDTLEEFGDHYHAIHTMRSALGGPLQSMECLWLVVKEAITSMIH